MRWVVFGLLLLSMPVMAQVSGSGKDRKFTVYSSEGNACSYDAPGSYEISKGGIASMVEACNRKDRGNAILAITGPTNRDLSRMTPEQLQALRCKRVRDQIETQKDLEAAGSSGVYNMSALRAVERQQCGSNEDR